MKYWNNNNIIALIGGWLLLQKKEDLLIGTTNLLDAAIYCRLSRDDDTHGESSSILTQKAMLSKYVQDQN